MIVNDIKNRKLKVYKEKFSILRPLLYGNDGRCIAEIKPYLQPFEEKLAIRELQVLIGEKEKVDFDGSYALFHHNDFDFLLDKLTYWQRVGIEILYPTFQVLREQSQSGFANIDKSNSLHKARRLRFGSHNIHEYRGKFFPQLVRSLLNISALPQDALVLDPMCGSGTTIVESTAQGFSGIGIDLNPLSVLISEAKYSLEQSDLNNLLALKEEFYSIINSKYIEKCIWNSNDLKYLNHWFNSECLCEISSLILAIKESKHDLNNVLLVCLSNIIREISFQKNTDLRVRKEIKKYEKGMAKLLLIKEFDILFDKNIAYKKLNQNLLGEAKIFNHDSRSLTDLNELKKRKADVLITSPPYATALPYLDTDRLSLICLGLTERNFHSKLESKMIGTREISEKKRVSDWKFYLENREELPLSITKLIDYIASINHNSNVGFRRKNLPTLLANYFFGMQESMKSVRNVLKMNAKAYYIVGNNSTFLDGNKFIINTPNLLFDLAESVGWKKSNISNMELLHSRDIFRKNRGSEECLLELINQ